MSDDFLPSFPKNHFKPRRHAKLAAEEPKSPSPILEPGKSRPQRPATHRCRIAVTVRLEDVEMEGFNTSIRTGVFRSAK